MKLRPRLWALGLFVVGLAVILCVPISVSRSSGGMSSHGVLIPCSARQGTGQASSSLMAQQQEKKDECKPWQMKDENGNCVDRPNTHHYHGHSHQPEPGETCWVECLCHDGERPSGNDCSPCSFVGTVCTRQ